MTPEELANLAHLRRARDLVDREYARPLASEDQPWGPRDCAFRDPSGNMVRISQAP